MTTETADTAALPFAGMAPADQFAAFWPDVRRYAGRVAANVARWSGADRADLFQAGVMAVWVQTARGALARTDDPLRRALCIVRWGISNQVQRHRKFARETAAGTWQLGRSDDDAPFLETIPAPSDDRRDGPSFDALLAHVLPADRDILARHFRDGELMTEIARDLGISRARVGQRIDRALARIRDHLGPESAA